MDRKMHQLSLLMWSVYQCHSLVENWLLLLLLLFCWGLTKHLRFAHWANKTRSRSRVWNKMDPCVLPGQSMSIGSPSTHWEWGLSLRNDRPQLWCKICQSFVHLSICLSACLSHEGHITKGSCHSDCRSQERNVTVATHRIGKSELSCHCQQCFICKKWIINGWEHLCLTTDSPTSDKSFKEIHLANSQSG